VKRRTGTCPLLLRSRQDLSRFGRRNELELATVVEHRFQIADLSAIRHDRQDMGGKARQ
jgi:hypothetical protein